MRVAIHQPNFLPWLGFFHKASRCDLFVLLDDVQFIKRGLTHRNYVKSPTGKQTLGVPVITKGRYHQTIAEVEINNDERWRPKVIGTLQRLYARAPGRDAVLPRLESTIQGDHTRLAPLNAQLLEVLFETLGVTTPVVRASDLPDVSGRSTERLISICRATGATEYLSGAGGKKYQDESAFEANGIRLTYSEFTPPTYPQRHGEFVPGLSAVDYVFNTRAPERLLNGGAIAA